MRFTIEPNCCDPHHLYCLFSSCAGTRLFYVLSCLTPPFPSVLPASPYSTSPVYPVLPATILTACSPVLHRAIKASCSAILHRSSFLPVLQFCQPLGDGGNVPIYEIHRDPCMSAQKQYTVHKQA